MATKKSTDGKAVLYCSFCGKSQHEVKKLIAGPEVFICDECIELCNNVILDEEIAPKVLSDEKLPTPKEIIAELDLHIIGQYRAKEILSIAARHHYMRVASGGKSKHGVEVEKANVLLIGPSGSGKTLLARTLARILKVPFAEKDLTDLTEAGYVGGKVTDMLTDLLASANGDIALAEKGVIFLDEGDKIVRKEANNSRDVSGAGAQHALLKVIEGTLIDVPLPGGKKHPISAETVKMNTKNILFIFAGAFDGLPDIIAKRLGESKSMGFLAKNVGGQAELPVRAKLLHKVTAADLILYGIDAQLVGRLHNVATLDGHDEPTLVRILTEPKNALFRQYQKIISDEGATLEYDAEAVLEIARKALLTSKNDTGARALRGICEKIFHSTFLSLPTLQQGEHRIAKVYLTAQHVREGKPPDLIYADQKLLK